MHQSVMQDFSGNPLVMLPQAFFANTLDEAKCLADKILSGYDYKRNDNYFLTEICGLIRYRMC